MGGEDSVEVVEKDLSGVKSKDDRQVPEGVVSDQF